jgi:streptogramin lyase
VYKETLSGGDYSQATVGSGWTQPAGIAVDGKGNLAIVDPGADTLFLETWSESQYTQTQIAGAGAAPTAVALDGSGNLYIVDQGSPEIGGVGGTFPLPAVNKFTSALPSTLNFGLTGYGYNPQYTTQTVALANYGSAALNFSAVSYPVDFPEASGVTTDCKSSTSLPVGSLCTLSIDFSPQQSLGTSNFRAYSENVSVTTNTGNTPGTVGKVSVTGTEEHPSSISITTSANPANQGGSLTFTATVTATDGFTLVRPAGTVTIYVDGSVAATPTLSGGVATYTTSTLALGTHTAFAYYAGNSVFLGSFSVSVSESVVLGSATAGFGDVTIGAVNIGAPSASIPLQVTFETADTLSSIAVLTQGAPNLDYAQTGGTCATGTAYAANATCTLDITFKPTAAGTRIGAVVLTGTNGNLAGTGYLQGIGQGSQTTFLPGTQINIASGFENPSGVAVDGAGNVYFADQLAAEVYKETFSDGIYSQGQIGSGFSCPTAVAVDAAANVYITDGCTASLYKETLVNGKYVQSTMGNGFGSPFGVAIDGSGNVYVADSTKLAVYKETMSNGQYSQSLVASGFKGPSGVTIDGSGNVYVADYAGNAVYKETPLGSGYTQSSVGTGLVAPEGVAVDGSGNLYIVEGTNTLYKESLFNGGYVATPILVGGSGSPDAVAVDAAGNLYIADKIAGGNLVFKLEVAAPPIVSFAATALGSTSIDSPHTVTVSDIGNEPLFIYSVKFAADFPEASGVGSDCKPNTFVGPGGACTLSIDFTPDAAIASGNSQTLSENVILTTNALNTTGTQQDVAVTGIENKSASYVALASSADPATLGSPVTFTSTVGPANGSSLTPTGTVTFYSGSAVLGAGTLVGGVATYSTSTLAVGTYSISAIYSGNASYNTATSNTISENIVSDPATGNFGDVEIGSVSIGSSTRRRRWATLRFSLREPPIWTSQMPAEELVRPGRHTPRQPPARSG